MEQVIYYICIAAAFFNIGMLVRDIITKRKFKGYEHVIYYTVSTNLMKEDEIPDEFIHRAINEGIGTLNIR